MPRCSWVAYYDEPRNGALLASYGRPANGRHYQWYGLHQSYFDHRSSEFIFMYRTSIMSYMGHGS